MKRIRINLNDKVKFRLTLWGKEVYSHRFDEVNEKLKDRGVQPITPHLPKLDEDGYCSMQLWDFMNTFGRYIGMALPNVVEPLDIIFEMKEEEDLPIITEASPASLGIYEKEQENEEVSGK